MVVDHCSVSSVVESINSSVEDRKACEASGTLQGESFLLNVYTPLQLGGRANKAYPPGLVNRDFDGCIGNLRHNGMVCL